VCAAPIIPERWFLKACKVFKMIKADMYVMLHFIRE
jgi:hypothetical protein